MCNTNFANTMITRSNITAIASRFNYDKWSGDPHQKIYSAYWFYPHPLDKTHLWNDAIFNISNCFKMTFCSSVIFVIICTSFSSYSFSLSFSWKKSFIFFLKCNVF
eukprot:296396_1